jgi:hypothetical protein
MSLDELVDVPIYHPLRYHREMVGANCHTQQWQHVWMAKGPPCHNLLAEPLHQSVSSPTCVIRKVVQTTHACNFPGIDGWVYTQNPNLATLVFVHPRVREKIAVQRAVRSIADKRNL